MNTNRNNGPPPETLEPVPETLDKRRLTRIVQIAGLVVAFERVGKPFATIAKTAANDLMPGRWMWAVSWEPNVRWNGLPIVGSVYATEEEAEKAILRVAKVFDADELRALRVAGAQRRQRAADASLYGPPTA